MSYHGKRPPQTCQLHVQGCTLADGTEVTMDDKLAWRGEVRVRSSDDYNDLYKLHSKNSFLWADAGAFGMFANEDPFPNPRPSVNPIRFSVLEVPSVYAVFEQIPETQRWKLASVSVCLQSAFAMAESRRDEGYGFSVRGIAVQQVREMEMIPGEFSCPDFEAVPGKEIWTEEMGEEGEE